MLVSLAMAGTLTANEEAQLLQTIEMFEVITLSQPMDYQSLEILKEAYSKLGREQDVINTAKRIAEAYVQLGQLSSAILEYESILQRAPDDPDVRKALGEIENKANSFSAPAPPSEAEDLLAPSGQPAAPGPAAAPVQIDDGRQQMEKIYMEAKLLASNDFDLYWPAPNMTPQIRQPVDPFIQVLSDRQVVPLDVSLRLLGEKARIAFLPIDRYEVDVDIVRAFPREVCMRWCILPFDRMSKSICVATANPFNKQALRDIEGQSKSRVIWYLSPPAELLRTVKKIFR